MVMLVGANMVRDYGQAIAADLDLVSLEQELQQSVIRKFLCRASMITRVEPVGRFGPFPQCGEAFTATQFEYMIEQSVTVNALSRHEPKFGPPQQIWL
jgi:hypothetical protein